MPLTNKSSSINFKIVLVGSCFKICPCLLASSTCLNLYRWLLVQFYWPPRGILSSGSLPAVKSTNVSLISPPLQCIYHGGFSLCCSTLPFRLKNSSLFRLWWCLEKRSCLFHPLDNIVIKDGQHSSAHSDCFFWSEESQLRNTLDEITCFHYCACGHHFRLDEPHHYWHFVG